MYNWILGSINLIAIIVMVTLKIFNKPFLVVDWEVKTAENVNDLLLNLSYGITGSSLFYLIIDYFPARQKEATVKLFVEPKIKLIVQGIYVSMFYLKNRRLNSANDLNNLTSEDFQNLTMLRNQDMNFRYGFIADANSTHFEREIEIDYFVTQREEVQKLINEMFSMPSIRYLNDDLIEILAKLRDCQFYRSVATNDTFRHFAIPIQNFNNHAFEYYSIYQKLLSHSPTIDEIENR